MTPADRTSVGTIGIIGAGKSGIALTRQALAAGYQVRIATSGPAERTALVAEVLTPGAVAVDADRLADLVELVILAVPLRRLHDLPLASFAGRIVVDVMNYWPPVDGRIAEFETDSRPSSALVQDALPATTRLVKTFNHIGYHEIEELAGPAGSPDRVALAIAGDDADAVAVVAKVVDALGFDAVLTGQLLSSTAFQPGSPAFGADLSRDALKEILLDQTPQAAISAL